MIIELKENFDSVWLYLKMKFSAMSNLFGISVVS